ncbi:AAA family ATPase [Clostridium sp. HBUAS56017]|uniref:AAA family ATPase n=1 Tax=Clostridium sp. HBUAS56017 TaxID=2571128 RepID=UPI0011781599|nr:AAA family ATPase [Clostridium sp. HBUAS56017]
MGKYNLLILDEDTFYINNLVNYISSNFNKEFNVMSFSDEEHFRTYLGKSEKIDIVLTSMEFFEKYKEKVKDKMVILLAKESLYNNDLPYIKKYQSVEKICRDIITIYESSEKESIERDTKAKLIAFYSPVGGIGTTTIAVNTAFTMAIQGEKVLYLSFENLQTIAAFMPNRKNAYNFSDLVLSIREDTEKFKNVLKNGVLKYEDSSLYYFNPVDSVLDIEDLNMDWVKELIDSIIDKGGFDYIMCDLPANLSSKFYYVFEKSVNIMSLIGQDPISSYKVDAMLKQLDDIKKFKFIINRFNEEKERLIPRLVSSNLLPIISSIPYYDEMYGVNDLKTLTNIDGKFNEKIQEIIEEIKK